MVLHASRWRSNDLLHDEWWWNRDLYIRHLRFNELLHFNRRRSIGLYIGHAHSIIRWYVLWCLKALLSWCSLIQL